MTGTALPLEVELDAGGQRHPYLVVDVFTGTALAGNQLGVLTDGRSLGTDDMQRLARELNLSETVFVLPAEQGGDVRIRKPRAAPAHRVPAAPRSSSPAASSGCPERRVARSS